MTTTKHKAKGSTRKSRNPLVEQSAICFARSNGDVSVVPDAFHFARAGHHAREQRFTLLHESHRDLPQTRKVPRFCRWWNGSKAVAGLSSIITQNFGAVGGPGALPPGSSRTRQHYLLSASQPTGRCRLPALCDNRKFASE